MKLKINNSHPRDKRIDFDETNHVYFIDGIPYELSVTGFIKSFFEEFCMFNFGIGLSGILF